LSEPPDVTAFELQRARQVLAAAGWVVAAEVVTVSRRHLQATSLCPRVLRQRVVGDHQVELVIADAPAVPAA
jgi:hypothetical protein